MSLLTLGLSNATSYIIFSLSGAALVAYLLYKYFDIRNNDIDEFRRRTSSSVSASEEKDIVLSRTPTPPNGFRRRLRRNPFKAIYSNIVRRQSVNQNANTTGLPHVLQRRHSTVFPLQVAKAAKDLFRGRGPFPYRRQMSEACRDAVLPQPPLEFFEPSAQVDIPDDLRPLFYIHHNIKLLELPPSWILSREDIDILEFEANSYIVQPGDEDDSIYVVLEGSLAAYISLPERKEYMVKRIDQGNSFFSLLSLIDILMRVPSVLRTVSLKATQPSRVAKFNFRRFQKSYQENPEAWVRPIQIVVTRLLHVTMTTLHQHLGLSEELLKQRLDDRSFDDRHRNVSGHSMKLSGKYKPRQRRLSSSDDSSELFSTAIRWVGEALKINFSDAQNILQTRMKIVSFDEDQVVVEQGSDDNPLLIMVLSGALKLSQECPADSDDMDENTWNKLIYPKELYGGLQLLSHEPSFFTARAACATTIAVINQQDFDEIVSIMPSIVLPVAHAVVRRLSSFIRAVDFAIDWELLDSGQAVYRQGDMADSIFVVLSGRLRSVSKKTVIEEFGRSDVLGILEMLQRKPRSTTVLAVRYSQLARVPEGLLNFVKIIFPQVGFRLVRLLGQYYYNDNRRCNFVQSHSLPLNDPISQTKNLHTIAIYPASNDVPLTSFTYELYHALSTNVRAIRLSRKTVAESLGEHVLEKQADFRLMHWLNAQEDNYQLVIYECDFDTSTNWTRRCLRQADAIFVVANGEIKPTRQHFLDEHLKMNQDGIRTRKELILLWKEDVQAPSGTFEWLKGSWFSGHYHIRAPNRMFQWEDQSEKDEDLIASYYETEIFSGKPDFNSDFSRVARILTGNAVGLVLGGGGARGAAHVGIIRALREHGIPVDIVGGTSIGSMIGGIFASDPNQDLKSIARSWFMMMSSLWRKIWDLTYWHSAIFTGAGFNRSLQDIFGDKYIEDLWLPYFCITTDISTSEMRVHRSGSLWAYSRASMSLAGYLPPLCDPKDGHLLLDGGYVNNLPADVMRNCGARCVIAVDVGAASETDLYNYGDSLSGLWVLCQRLNPWASPVRILGMEEIQSRLAFVSCVQQLELVKKAPYCHYLRPPIDEFQTLDFVKFDTICDRGYQYGTERLSELIKSNANIKSVMNPEKLHLLAKSHLRHESGLRKPSMRNSFTDLAAQISRIPPRKHHGSLKSLADISIYGDSDWDEEEDEIRSESGSRRQSDATEIGDFNDDPLSRVVTPRV